MIKKIFAILDSITAHFCKWALVLSVGLMLIFSLTSIVLRWFETTYLWIDPFVRHLVFLSAFLGGALATGNRTHIGIDVVSKYLEGKSLSNVRRHIGRLIDLVCFLALIWLTKAAWEFTKVEWEFGKEAFLGIHSAFLVSIIPFGLTLIAFRFLNLFVQSFGQPIGIEKLVAGLREH